MSFDPDRINIHELTIEEPEKQSELPFDPEKDITEDDWAGMMGEFQFRKNRPTKTKWEDVVLLGSFLKTIKPDIDLGLDEEAEVGIKKVVKKKRQGANLDPAIWTDFCQYAIAAKTILPDYDLHLTDRMFDKLKGILDEERRDDIAPLAAILATDLKMLFPGRDLGLDANFLHSQEAEAASSLKQEGAEIDSLPWSEQFKEMKILYPSRAIGLDSGAWKIMRRELSNYRHNFKGQSDWWQFALLAMKMKILAAQDVKVTNKGLEVNMRKSKPDKPIESVTPPLPETKQF